MWQKELEELNAAAVAEEEVAGPGGVAKVSRLGLPCAAASRRRRRAESCA